MATLLLLAPLALARVPVAVLRLLSPLALDELPAALLKLLSPLASAKEPQAMLPPLPTTAPPPVCRSSPVALPPHTNCAAAGGAASAIPSASMLAAPRSPTWLNCHLGSVHISLPLGLAPPEWRAVTRTIAQNRTSPDLAAFISLRRMTRTFQPSKL